MTAGQRFAIYLVAFILLVLACLVEIAQTKKVTVRALISAGLAVLTLAPLVDTWP